MYQVNSHRIIPVKTDNRKTDIKEKCDCSFPTKKQQRLKICKIRCGKATGKYKNECNNNNSINNRFSLIDVASFEIAPPTETNIQQQLHEALLAEVYTTEIENQATTAKSTKGLRRRG